MTARLSHDGRPGRLGHRTVRAAARLRPGTRVLPTFLLIGAKRCGTTSLFANLVSHPAVLGPRLSKSTHYFDVNYGRGVRWYESAFPTERQVDRCRQRTGHEVAIGEASPLYLFHPLAPERVGALLPEARLVAVLREPVARAWSHYCYEVRRGYETHSFEEALAAEGSRLEGAGYASLHYRHHSYLARGRYAEQLARYLAVFPASRLLLLEAEAFYSDPVAVTRRVWSFLGVPQVDSCAFPGPLEVGSTPDIPEGIREQLQEYYDPYNLALTHLADLDFSWLPGP